MEYQKFLDDLAGSVGLLVGDGMRVTVRGVLKNNGLVLDGMSIEDEGMVGTPTVYVNQYYNQYQAGRSLESIAREIVQVKEAHMDRMPANAGDYFEFEKVSASITYKLINFKENELLLKDVPHKKMLDLAVVFQCILKNDKDGVASVLVKNSHLEMWGVDAQKVFELSLENTPRLFPAKLMPMYEMIERTLNSDGGAPAVSEGLPGFMEFPMYVLTNENMTQGACCILYDGVLESFADKLDSDLVIIPSSIHEVLLVPASEDKDFSEFNRMVQEVNRVAVEVDEVLSWQVYLYRRSTRMIEETMPIPPAKNASGMGMV